MVGLAAGKGIDEKSGVGAAEGADDHEGDGVRAAAATDADGITLGVGPKANAVAVVRTRKKVAAGAVRANLANIEIIFPVSILKSAARRVNYVG